MLVKNPNYTDIYFIYQEGQRIGTISLRDDGSLWNFNIGRKFRGKGYGKRALQDILNLIRVRNLFTEVKLYVIKNNTIALNLYESLGFKITKDYGETYEMIIKLI